MFLCISHCMQSVRILKSGHCLRITALIKHPQNRKSENSAEEMYNPNVTVSEGKAEEPRRPEVWKARDCQYLSCEVIFKLKIRFKPWCLKNTEEKMYLSS